MWRGSSVSCSGSAAPQQMLMEALPVSYFYTSNPHLCWGGGKQAGLHCVKGQQGQKYQFKGRKKKNNAEASKAGLQCFILYIYTTVQSKGFFETR